MKHILLYTRPIIPPWDEGSKNLAYDISRHLAGDFAVHVLTTKNAFTAENFHRTTVVMERIFDGPSLHLSAKWALIKRMFQTPFQADIVHFLFTPRALTSWIIKQGLARSHAKSVQTIATIPDQVLDDPDQLRHILFADRIVAQSHYTTNRLRTAGFSNVECIYPGIDLQTFNPSLTDTHLRSTLPLDPNAFVFLFAGEYARLHAIDDLVSAIDILLKSRSTTRTNRPIAFIVACRIKTKQDQKKKLQVVELINQLGYTKQVMFLDAVPDMPALYALSDVNLFPVRTMTGKFDIPLVLIESMACGKPVICSDLPMLTECVQHEKNGLVVPPGDPRAIARAMMRFIDEPDLVQSLGTQSAQCIRSSFDIAHNILAYQRIYQTL